MKHLFRKGIKVALLGLAAAYFSSCAPSQRVSVNRRDPAPSIQVMQAKAKARDNDRTGLVCVLLFGLIMFNKVAE
jgi:hypothetical protein